MLDPNDKSKSWGEQVDELLDDLDNPQVSDEEYEERRAELDKEADERNKSDE